MLEVGNIARNEKGIIGIIEQIIEVDGKTIYLGKRTFPEIPLLEADGVTLAKEQVIWKSSNPSIISKNIEEYKKLDW